MPGLAIVGAQWGDEGKGKVTDLLAEQADVIVAKHRNGPIGDVVLTFLSRYPKFANLYRDHAMEARPAAVDSVG